ncbi:hypothetical protein IAR55_005395 [Kwoniella newhampshirensis]|uniref:Uncharacterized protein n=1 Tax=Kwoniella newhampshirensis TaxID=1651941 RepID=A0AAW0YVH5_9TREE
MTFFLSPLLFQITGNGMVSRSVNKSDHQKPIKSYIPSTHRPHTSTAAVIRGQAYLGLCQAPFHRGSGIWRKRKGGKGRF